MVDAEKAELLGLSIKRVRVGAEGVRPSEEESRDEDRNDEDEEPDCSDRLEKAMARQRRQSPMGLGAALLLLSSHQDEIQGCVICSV